MNKDLGKDKQEDIKADLTQETKNAVPENKTPSKPSLAETLRSKYKKLSQREKDRYSAVFCAALSGVLLIASGIGYVKINDMRQENQSLIEEKQLMAEGIEQSAKNSEKLGSAMVSISLAQEDFVFEMPSEQVDAMVTDIIKEAGYTPKNLKVEMINKQEAKVSAKAVGNSYDNLLALVESVNSKRYIAIDSFEAIVDGETDPKGETALKKVTTSETKTRLVPVIDEETGEVTYETEEYTVPKEEYVEIDQEESVKEIAKEIDVVFTVKMISQ